MKIGLQTISLGVTHQNFDRICGSISDLGFEGVEIAQPVSTIGGMEYIQESLEKHGLLLAGLSGGSLPNRIEHSKLFKPDYLYLDEWDELAVLVAKKSGRCIGLHPHKYKDMESVNDAAQYLGEYDNTMLILDTAHLYLANEHIVDALKIYMDRTIAIHIKDWTELYGRSPFYYAQGFTTLGKGVLNKILEETVSYIKQFDYPGWVIVEQDTAHGSPLDCAKNSRQWLREHGI